MMDNGSAFSHDGEKKRSFILQCFTLFAQDRWPALSSDKVQAFCQLAYQAFEDNSINELNLLVREIVGCLNCRQDILDIDSFNVTISGALFAFMREIEQGEITAENIFKHHKTAIKRRISFQ